MSYWDTKQHIIDCDPDDGLNWEVEMNRNPEWREQLIAELNGEPIGFILIIDPYLEEAYYSGNVESNKERATLDWRRKEPKSRVWN